MTDAQKLPGKPQSCGLLEHCAQFPSCGCDGRDPLSERDPFRTQEKQGLFRKYEVKRIDGTDQGSGKHAGCEYFVLDISHDKHAHAALTAYALSAMSTNCDLARDMALRYGLDLSAANPTPADRPAVVLVCTCGKAAKQGVSDTQFES